MSETKISKDIQKMVDTEFPDIELTRTQAGSVKVRGGYMHLAKKGWPDRSGYMPDGRFLGIEVKDPRGKTEAKHEANQRERIADINSKGGVGLLVDSVEQAREALKEALRVKKNVNYKK